MRKIGILGSTGSIGTQTLEVIEAIDEQFQIVYLTANNNVELLIKQVEKFNPKYICIGDSNLRNQITMVW